MDEKLYTELFRLRAKLKQEPTQDGRTPTVCTDRALLDLANACPKTKEELTLVAGLGKTFADKYGDAFLAVISDYRKEKCDNILLAEDVRTVLKNLENRLVNINKKNRLLYQGKLYNKYAVDLYDKKRAKNAELVKRLLFGGKEVVICDLRTGEIRENEKNYKKILMLIREVEKDLRESGQYELYVGYPYAVGKMRGDDFNIRAPLALFPVEIRREADFITLKADKSRDILFNNNLILTHNKLNSLKKDLPQNSVQSETAEGFESELYEFFSTNGIELLDFENIVTDEGSDLESFLEYKTTDFPKFKSGEYRVVRNAVLGKFSFYSGALQKDFKDIIDGDEINGLLSELLENAGESDFFAEAADGAEKRAEEIREHDLFYINELNASQERAAVSALTDKNLVIQGPPGTGKSQTITSIIADFARRGKTVAMVSQKKAAIDVIYSRLGTLSKYALMIDDVKDKEGFYVQLERLFSAPAVIPIAPSAAVSNAARDAVSSTVRSSSIPNANGGEEIDGAVDARIDRLERIAKTLYETDSHGNVLYRIYLENMRNIYLDGDFSDAAVMNEKLSDAVRGFCYAEIKKLKGFFEYGNNAVETERYFRIQGKYPWLDTLKRGLNVFETAEMEKAAKGFEDAQTDYQKQNVFKRILKRGEQKKALKGFLNKYFENQDCQKLFFETPRLLGKGLAKRGEYVGARSVLLTLSEREREYSENLYAVSKALDFEIKLANRRIYDYLVFCIIDRFESENREILKDVTNYETVVREICEAMNRKKDLSRDTLRAYLDGCYREHILRSKRSGEMRRQQESKRKPSVMRYVKKFEFELFKGIKIWMMTPEVVSEIMPLEADLFDLLIFDEASQIYVEKGIPAIARAKKVLIVGDHKQLRPSGLGIGRADFAEEESEEAEESEGLAALEEESLLDLARFKFPSVVLDYHYRSKYEELIAFSNYAFYKGRLHVSPNVSPPEKPPIEVIKVEDGKWIDRTNLAEAERVVRLLKDFFASRKKAQTVGIITFNSYQRDLVMDLLDREGRTDPAFSDALKRETERKENGEDIGLFVKNIENVQGDERDCIIFSIAYAKNESGKVVRNFGWLNQRGGENRLNVAISRAKEKIYIVTSIEPFELSVGDLANNGPKLFKKYLEYACAVSRGDKAAARTILIGLCGETTEADISTADTEFEDAVYESLAGAGYEVERGIGIGGYRIDLAVKKDGKYLLGIECDGKLYIGSDSTRERDVHRQKYLESRGWSIYRLRANRWWRDPKGEIARIAKQLKAKN